MGSGLPFVLQLLLLFVVIGQLLCVDSSLVKDSMRSTRTTTNPQGGFTASLIRRDQYFADKSDVYTPREEKVRRDARRSMLRVQSLVSKRQLAEMTGASDPPLDSSDWETALSDLAPAEYLMKISLGTPAQNFVAVADTGSDLTWLECSRCGICKEDGQCGFCTTGNYYDQTKSSTNGLLGCDSPACEFLNATKSFCPIASTTPSTGCEYGYEYGDGSKTKGFLASETITFQAVAGGSQTVDDYWFGCSRAVTSTSGLLDKTDGLVGLGRGNISLPSQLGKYFGDKFGYCLVNRSASNAVENSPLFFGSDAVPNITSNGSQLQYTPFLTNAKISTFYYVNCTGISLAGKSIATIPPSAFDITSDGDGGIFFDSGTTFTSLADNIFDSLSSAIRSQITDYKETQSEFPLCYLASWSDWVNAYGHGVPIISFQFSNTSGFPLVVDTAWIKLTDTIVCLAMQTTGSNISIFGNFQQVGYHILYDLKWQQLGFVQADCKNNSHRRIASVGTSMLSGLLSLLLLLVLTH